jgi:hypothetical protein
MAQLKIGSINVDAPKPTPTPKREGGEGKCGKWG